MLIEHAAMLIARGGLGDDEQAEGLLSQALATCEELDLSGVEEHAARLLAQRGDGEACPAASPIARRSDEKVSTGRLPTAPRWLGSAT